jgi:hypothetical protein
MIGTKHLAAFLPVLLLGAGAAQALDVKDYFDLADKDQGRLTRAC